MRSILFHAAIAALVPLAGSARAQGLAAVGPVSPDHGFPEWYEDPNGLRLGACLTDVGLCLMDAPVSLIDPALPFPDNYGGAFADHVFYNACEASMESGGNGGLALLVITLQGGFANDLEAAIDGDQDVFARLRIRIDNLVQGQTYEVVTPMGTYTFIAENSTVRGINFTDDVGRLMPGVFGAELGGAIGPWLTWDTDLPITDAAGNEYVGDPAIEHTITGSPFGTNVFRVTGPNVGGPGVNMIQTELFSIIGVLAGDPTDPPPPPPPPAGFELAVTPALAGALNSFTATGGPEGGIVAFLYSFNAGARTIFPAPCPMGVGLDVLNPRLLGLNQTNGGASTINLTIPAALAGRTLHMQAIDVANCTASNLVTATL